MANQRISLKARSRSLRKLKQLLEITISSLADLRASRHSRCTEYQADIGQLLLLGQLERAVIRSERVIREQNMLDVLEMVESYCTDIKERACLLLEQRECPDELRVAAAGLVFVASRCVDSGYLPTLQDVRCIFVLFFGEEFAAKATELRNSCSVSGELVRKFSKTQPSLDIRLKSVKEIAMGIGIQLDLADPIFKIPQALSEPRIEYPVDKEIMALAWEQYKCVKSAAQAAADSAALTAAVASTLLELLKLQHQK